ncbi:MAG: hypothetical protein ACLRWH_10065 [Emergencia sp.]
MKKKVCMLCMILCIAVVGSCVSVYGAEAEDPGIEPYAEYYLQVSTQVKITGGTATATANIIGKAGLTTKLSTQLYLQRYSGRGWITVASWSESANRSVLTLEKTKAVPKGYKYRTKAVFTAYAGTKSETRTRYSGTLSY